MAAKNSGFSEEISSHRFRYPARSFFFRADGKVENALALRDV
jgi:hypothetical protein